MLTKYRLNYAVFSAMRSMARRPELCVKSSDIAVGNGGGGGDVKFSSRGSQLVPVRFYMFGNAKFHDTFNSGLMCKMYCSTPNPESAAAPRPAASAGGTAAAGAAAKPASAATAAPVVTASSMGTSPALDSADAKGPSPAATGSSAATGSAAATGSTTTQSTATASAAPSLPDRQQLEKMFFRVLVILWDTSIVLYGWSKKNFEKHVVENPTVQLYWKQFLIKMEKARKE